MKGQQEMIASQPLPESFQVPWAKPDDPRVKSAYQQQQHNADSKFLELSRCRRTASSLSKSDHFWDSCDQLMEAGRSAELESPPPDVFQPNDFRVLSKLGQGGFGCVYKALHVETGHVVALKELTGNASEVEIFDHRTLPWDCGVVPCYGTFRATSQFTPSSEENDDDKITAVTTKETAALAQDTSRLKTWLILKLCKGGSLLDRLTGEGGVLSEQEAARMLKGVVKTLLHLMEHHGLVHNDCKPANLLLADDGQSYYLCDLGSAQKGLWQTNRLGGTYSYMPPEKLRARKLSGFLTHYCNHEKHDVWAMGVTLFAALFARHPFNAKALAKCTTVTSSGQDASRFYDLMETNFDTIQYPKDGRVLSEELKDLLQGMLIPYCLERLTLACVKEHSWVQRRGARKVWSHAKVFVRRLSRRQSNPVTLDQAFVKVLWQPTVGMDDDEDDSSPPDLTESTKVSDPSSRLSMEGSC